MTLDELIDTLTDLRQKLESDAPVRLSIRENATDTPSIDTFTGMRVTARHFSIHAALIDEGIHGPVVLIESAEHAADVM